MDRIFQHSILLQNRITMTILTLNLSQLKRIFNIVGSFKFQIYLVLSVILITILFLYLSLSPSSLSKPLAPLFL